MSEICYKTHVGLLVTYDFRYMAQPWGVGRSGVQSKDEVLKVRA